MSETYILLMAGALTCLPLIGALVSVMIDRARWIRFAEKKERQQEALIRWLANNCKEVGDFEKRADNIIQFKPRR